MPTISGEIFKLGAGAGADEWADGWVDGQVGGQVRARGQLHAKFCHGANLAADISISGDVEGKLQAVLPFVRTTGEALAGAGVALKLGFDANLFKEFGFMTEAAARAEAALYGKLGVGLAAEDLLERAQAIVDDELLRELVIAFLQEVTMEAGVWGSISASAQAEAYVHVKGNLSDDADAGFWIQAGYGAGYGVGTAWDFYCGMGLDRVRRWYGRAVWIITKHLGAELRAIAPPAQEPACELLEIVLPIALHSAFELGQQASLQTLGSPGDLVQPFLRVAGEQFQRWLLEKLAEAAANQLRGLVDEALAVAAGRPPANADSLATSIEQVVGTLEDGRLDLEDLPVLVDATGRLVTFIGGDAEQRWRRPVAIAWTVAALGAATRDIGRAWIGFSATSLIGDYDAQLTLFPMPDRIPDDVRTEYREALNQPMLRTIEVATGFDYLAEVGVMPLLAQHLPGAAAIAEHIRMETGITIGDMLAGGLEVGSNSFLTQTVAYEKLGGWARRTVEERIRDELLRSLDTRIAPDSPLRLYLNEVVEPSLALLVDFVFDRFDALAADPPALGNWDEIENAVGQKAEPFLQTFSEALSVVVWKVAARNMSWLADQLLVETVWNGVAAQAGALATEIQGTNDADISHRLIDEATPLLPLFGADSPTVTQKRALKYFLIKVFGVLEEMASEPLDVVDAYPGSLTDETDTRRERLRNHLVGALESLDGSVNWKDKGALVGALQTFAECSPANIPAARHVFETFLVHAQILRHQLEIALDRLPGAMATLAAGLTLEPLQEIKEAVDNLFGGAQRTLSEAQGALAGLSQRIAELLDKLEQAQRQLALRIAELRDRLRSPALRREIRDHSRLWGIRRGPLVAMIDALDGLAGAIESIVLASANTTELIDRIRAWLTQEIQNALQAAGYALQIAQNQVDGFLDRLIDLTGSQIGAAGGAAALVHDREVEYDAELESQGQEASDVIEAKQRVEELTPTGTASIEIVEPRAPTAGRDSSTLLVYPRKVNASVVVSGIKPSYADQESLRIRLALNGTQLSVGGGHFQDDGTTWVWQQPLNEVAPRKGLNTFEVSVLDDGDWERDFVSFLVDLSVLDPRDDIQVEKPKWHRDLREYDHMLDITGPPGRSLRDLIIEIRSGEQAKLRDVDGQHSDLKLPSSGRTQVHWGKRDGRPKEGHVYLGYASDPRSSRDSILVVDDDRRMRGNVGRVAADHRAPPSRRRRPDGN